MMERQVRKGQRSPHRPLSIRAHISVRAAQTDGRRFFEAYEKLILLVCIVLGTENVSARKAGVYCFSPTGTNAVYEDENLRVMIGVDGGKPCWIVANKSDRRLYIDKGSSCSYKNNEPTCLDTGNQVNDGTCRAAPHGQFRSTVLSDDEQRHLEQPGRNGLQQVVRGHRKQAVG